MGLRCIACKKLKGPDNRTYHRFPRDVKRREIWAIILGMKTENIPKVAFVCSNHFGPSDFIIKPQGAVWLTKDAVPKQLNVAPIMQSPQSKLVMEKRELEAAQEVEKRELEAAQEDYALLSQESESSSSTLTANSPSSSIKRKSSAVKVISRLRKKRKLKNPRYFGDCDSVKMTDLVRAKQNWNLARKTIIQQRKKINSLLATNRRLRDRIRSLKSLMSYLKRKNMISKTGESMVTIFQ